MNIEAKDFLDNSIKIGDTVVFMRLNYRNFVKGTVTHITEKTLQINHNFHYTTKQFHNQVIVINKINGDN